MITFTVIKTRLRAVLLLSLVMLFTTLALGQKRQPPPPPDPGRGATIWGFEVDADFRTGFIPPFWTPSTAYDPDYNPVYYPNLNTFGIDWQSLLLYNPTTHKFSPKTATDKRTTGSVDGNWGNQSQVPEVVSFAGTSNKNGDMIGSGQSPYLLQLGGTGPQKNDITNTFLHSREYLDSTVLVYAAETRATNGSSYLDFEYNQAGVLLDTLDGHINLIGKGLNGGRTPGDFILVVDYVGGGQTPIVSARVWKATGANTGQWGDSIGIDRLHAYIAANVFNVQALDSINKSSYTDNGAPTGTTKALQMVEGAVNITYLMGTIPDFQDLNLCSPNATVTVKTRSSASFTAELKDLDVIPFSIIPGPAGNNTSQALCPDTIGHTWATFDLTKDTAYVSGSDGFVVGWYKDSLLTQSGLISTPNAFKATNGTIVYAKLANLEGCEGIAADTLKVFTSPTGTNTSQSSCPDKIGGTTATFNLTTKNSTVTGGAAGVIVNGWFTTYNSTTNAFTGSITDSAAYAAANGTVVYARLKSANNCFGVAADTLKVFTSPVGTNTSQALCSDTIGGTYATFNLKLKNSTVTGGAAGVIVNGWFTAYNSTTDAFSGPIADSAAFKAVNNTVVYARLKSANNCYGVAADTLKVYTTPPGTNTSQSSCPDKIGGTTATFNLTTKNSTVTGGAAGVSVVGWFTGFNTTTGIFSGEISTPGAYSAANNTVVYAKISNATNCFGVAADTLKVFASPVGANTSQALCPDNINGTTATFNLTSKNSTVVGSSGASVDKWFTGYNSTTDAFTGEITTPGAYSAANGTVVYARLKSANNCYGVAADTLKVFTSPGKPAVTYNAPACDAATFSVTISSVVQGVTYYIKDKNGDAIPGVSPASGYVAPNTNNFNFSNIPAGSGYQVWVLGLNGCLSDTTSCGSPSLILTKAATAPGVKDEVKTEQPDQKALAATDIKASIGAQTRAAAAPNPFTDKVRFTLESAVSGQGSLEIYNTLGQKLYTVYQGYVEAGKILTKEYVVPKAQRANLIYIFRVGDQKATGKLINR